MKIGTITTTIAATPEPTIESLITDMRAIYAAVCASSPRPVAPTTDDVVAAIREMGA